LLVASSQELAASFYQRPSKEAAWAVPNNFPVATGLKLIARRYHIVFCSPTKGKSIDGAIRY
jgi:hypothetical protein